MRSDDLTAAVLSGFLAVKIGKKLDIVLEAVSKLDVELFPFSEDFPFGIEANVAIKFPPFFIEKNLGRDFFYAVFISGFGVCPDVNIPYHKFPLIAGP